VWLSVRRLKRFSRKEFDAEVCGRKLFHKPDAALHSALPVAALLVAAVWLLSHDSRVGKGNPS
jgi:hypothetical protein